MTVRDLAAEFGVSRQAVYKKLKSRGISLLELQVSDTDQLSDVGAQVMRDMFTNKHTTKTVDNPYNSSVTTVDVDVQPMATADPICLPDLHAVLNSLSTTLDALTTVNAKNTTLRDELVAAQIEMAALKATHQTETMALHISLAQLQSDVETARALQTIAETSRDALAQQLASTTELLQTSQKLLAMAIGSNTHAQLSAGTTNDTRTRGLRGVWMRICGKK